MSVERLTPNYQETLGMDASSGLFGDPNQGSPILFRIGDNYIATFGNACCFCKNASPPR